MYVVRQPQSLIFLKNGLKLIKDKTLEMILKNGKTEADEAQSWL